MKKSVLCSVPNEGAWCLLPVVMEEPLPLCDLHRTEIVKAALPEILSAVMDRSRQLALTGADQVDNAISVVMPLRLPENHMPVVYFLRNGARVKIGYTTRLSARISALSLRRESVVLLLAGGRTLESALHDRFQVLRDPRTEWFELGGSLQEYIQDRAVRANRVPLEARSEPRSSVRISSADSWKLVEQRLDHLISTGRTSVSFGDFRDLPAVANRSRGWVYDALNRLVENGRLIKSGPSYEVPGN